MSRKPSKGYNSLRSKRACIFHSYLAIFSIMLCSFFLLAPLVMAQQPERDTTGPIVGIDLGTTYSCVGVYRGGKVEIIQNDQGNRITPSYVAFTKTNERLVGDAAKNQATMNPENTLFDVKRLIGRRFSDKSVQADKKLFPFNIISSGSEDKPRIKLSHTHDGKQMTYAPEDISAMVLSKMKATAESYLGEPVTRAVVTVPAYFNDEQRQATKDAGRIAGLHVERIINEPTAAAIAYGSDRDFNDSNVLVFDLGGGTFDVTLLNIDDGAFEVLATHGDTHLGGEDFDQRVMQYFIEKMEKEEGPKVEDISKNNRALQKLRKEVERVKRALSTQTQARLEIDDLVPGYDFQETLTRARFEELNNDLFKRTLGPVKQVLDRTKMSKSDIDQIVLVGGSTRIPKVQQLLSEYFGGKELSKSVNPDEAVAYGAAVQGAILAGETTGKEDKIVLLDVTPLSKGIETVGGLFTKIIPRDTKIPTKKSQLFSTHQDNQSRVVIDVYEGERSMTKDNHHLGKFDLTGIPPAPRGVPQIEVTFEVDVNGILQVSAQDKGTGKAETITITANQGRLSEEEIEQMIQDAQDFAEEDRLLKERMEIYHGLESYLYNLRHTFDQTSDSKASENAVSLEDRKLLMDMVNDALDWLGENPDATKEDLDEKQKEVEQVANPLIRQFYNSDGSGDGVQEDDFDDIEL